MHSLIALFHFSLLYAVLMSTIVYKHELEVHIIFKVMLPLLGLKYYRFGKFSQPIKII